MSILKYAFKVHMLAILFPEDAQIWVNILKYRCFRNLKEFIEVWLQLDSHHHE
jgi:hypothetical protein